MRKHELACILLCAAISLTLIASMMLMRPSAAELRSMIQAVSAHGVE